MATYVLVHGAAHGGWCYRNVARLLLAKGHEVHTPTLTGLGEREHLLGEHVDLELHIQDIVNVLLFEDLRNVILAGHSYGGMVITGAADRAIDRVGHLVYLDAAYPSNGQSLIESVGPIMNSIRQTARVVNGLELVFHPAAEVSSMPYMGVTDQKTIDWLATKLTPHPWKTFEQKLRLANEESLWRIPQTHILCTSGLDRTAERPRMEKHSNGRIWHIDTGHDLMITEPERVAEMLLRLA